ncbi:hypothetical protein WJX79_008099 [Trebouxia sp. C0005]
MALANSCSFFHLSCTSLLFALPQIRVDLHIKGPQEPRHRKAGGHAWQGIQVLEGPLGSDVADLDTAAEELEVEDPGLRDLAMRLTENALHQGSVLPDSQASGMGDEQGGRGNAVSAAVKPEPVDAPGVHSGRQPMNNDVDTEMQLLQEGGMLATHRHESILGHKKVELSGGQHLIMKQGPGWVVMSLMVEGAIAFIAV